jgi:hypothetical protein
MQLTKTKTLIQKTKIKANRLAKETWYGPGKFGIIILIGMIIVGVHESLNNGGENVLKTIGIKSGKLDVLSIFSPKDSATKIDIEKQKLKLIMLKQTQTSYNDEKEELDMIMELAQNIKKRDEKVERVEQDELDNSYEHQSFAKLQSDQMHVPEVDEAAALEKFFQDGQEFINF